MNYTVTYIDHDGVETETRCFSRHHADVLMQSLAAAGLEHWVGRAFGRSVRHEARGFPVADDLDGNPVADPFAPIGEG